MDSFTTYPIPDGVDAIPHDELDLRSDAEVDYELLNPKPITDEKNLWFFWNSGFQKMHGYHQRTVRNWHRRFSRKGWVVRLLDVEPGSSLNVANYLDVQDPEVFPKAFAEGTIGGRHVNQHISDLVRFPLLLRYGGVYADVGLVQIGDLDSRPGSQHDKLLPGFETKQSLLSQVPQAFTHTMGGKDKH
ncbi:uncharacterized protein TrAtP1_012097 [Trichoderma atroviride]|uniref:uncharacterized protein n=1 Tax=Hypocrea atroviridis TaxID=63577 RepID=UPI003330508A|nr:hypothetical protein TrAtP1_012097 [Trichoderma atroviride]